MKPLFTGATCSAAVLALSMAVFAHTTQTPAPQAPSPSTPAAQEPAKTADAQPSATIIGCVQREADYRRAKNAGGGGVAGTGVGTGNEFVLVNASMGAAAGSTSPTGAVGTSGVAAGSEAFELTGPGESKLEQYVGRRVEIAGKMKAAAAASDRPSPPPVDIKGQDLNLKEFEVVSVREAAGSCPSDR